MGIWCSDSTRASKPPGQHLICCIPAKSRFGVQVELANWYILRYNWNMFMRSYSNEKFSDAVATSETWSQVSVKLNVVVGGSSYKFFKKLAKELNTDYSHFRMPTMSINGKLLRRPIGYYLTNGSDVGSNKLKLRLLKEGIKGT